MSNDRTRHDDDRTGDNDITEHHDPIPYDPPGYLPPGYLKHDRTDQRTIGYLDQRTIDDDAHYLDNLTRAVHDYERRPNDGTRANLNLAVRDYHGTLDAAAVVLVDRDDFDFLVDAINNSRSDVYLANCARALVINQHDAAAAVRGTDDGVGDLDTLRAAYIDADALYAVDHNTADYEQWLTARNALCAALRLMYLRSGEPVSSPPPRCRATICT